MRLPLLAILLVTVGCGDPPPPDPTFCKAGFIGDPALAPEAVMLFSDGFSLKVDDVTPGQAIPLEPPPQGGYVMYLAARVRNMQACVEFQGRLRDPQSNDEVGFDARGSTLKLGADGWGYPDASNNANVSNVNGCPDYTSKDVHGGTYNLEMVVVDRLGNKARVTQPIVPTCALADPLLQKDCVCTCSANYTLGKCNFTVDGGAKD